MTKSQKVLEELWPCEIVVNGEAYGASTGRFRMGSEFADGGEVEDREVRIRVRKEVLEERLPVGTRLLYRDVESDIEEEVRVVGSTSDAVARVYLCGAVDE